MCQYKLYENLNQSPKQLKLSYVCIHLVFLSFGLHSPDSFNDDVQVISEKVSQISVIPTQRFSKHLNFISLCKGLSCKCLLTCEHFLDVWL